MVNVFQDKLENFGSVLQKVVTSAKEVTLPGKTPNKDAVHVARLHHLSTQMAVCLTYECVFLLKHWLD